MSTAPRAPYGDSEITAPHGNGELVPWPEFMFAQGLMKHLKDLYHTSYFSDYDQGGATWNHMIGPLYMIELPRNAYFTDGDHKRGSNLWHIIKDELIRCQKP